MPTYDYVCEGCSNEFEEFQSITAKPLKKCPKCAQNKLRRKIGTGAGIIFKGSGFYATDYRSDSYTKAAKADKEAASPKSDSSSSSGGEATGGSSESKPAPAPARSESKPAKSETKAAKPSKAKAD